MSLKNNNNEKDFPRDPVVKNIPANVENMGPISDPGRSHMPRSN